MRWIAGRRQTHSAPRRINRWWLLRSLTIALAGAACLVLVACGSASRPQLNLPGGAYSSATYGFHVTYPRNWQANPYDATPSANNSSVAAIPFTLVITHTGDASRAASLISTCTITVMNLKNSDIAQGVATLATDTALQATTVGGAPGYKSKPLTQDIPNSQISVTHTDYFVVHGDYEYQLSTDSVKGDNADTDLQNIIASFAFNG